MAESNTTKKVLIGVGVGCLGLVLLCCASGGGLLLIQRSSLASAAQDHAEQFLGQVQQRDWPGALQSASYMGDTGLYSVGAHQRCVEDTALGDLTSYSCHDVDVDLVDSDADVRCSVESASRGTVEPVIHVNNADGSPYLGFYWFGSRSDFGATWASDACSSWSGREYVYGPPSGTVRP
ncbi:MAG: hypothetical protein AB8I08_25475 [Sandaracinaceae bacterium]